MLQKNWWLSRTIWTGIIGTLFAVLNALGLLPAELSSDVVVNGILGITAVLAIVLRVNTDTTIVLTKPAE